MTPMCSPTPAFGSFSTEPVPTPISRELETWRGRSTTRRISLRGFTLGWSISGSALPGDAFKEVQQPLVYELAVNLKTWKTLGLTVPQSLLLRANKVIQCWIVPYGSRLSRCSPQLPANLIG